MTRWNDDDQFWVRFAPFMFTPARLEATSREVDQVTALVGTAPGRAVLDLCCGPGRHSVELAARGCQVTGVDRTGPFLEMARARPGAAAVEWVQEDARRFRRPAAFDVALNLFTSFGYFDSPDEERAMVENLYASLRPGGQLLMDVLGKEVLARTFRESDAKLAENGAVFVELRTVRSGWDWVDSKYIVVDETGRYERDIAVRLYSAGELTALLRRAGFAEVDVFGSFAGTPYDHAAQRLVVRARKAA